MIQKETSENPTAAPLSVSEIRMMANSSAGLSSFRNSYLKGLSGPALTLLDMIDEAGAHLLPSMKTLILSRLFSINIDEERCNYLLSFANQCGIDAIAALSIDDINKLNGTVDPQIKSALDALRATGRKSPFQGVSFEYLRHNPLVVTELCERYGEMAQTVIAHFKDDLQEQEKSARSFLLSLLERKGPYAGKYLLSLTKEMIAKSGDKILELIDLAGEDAFSCMCYLPTRLIIEHPDQVVDFYKKHQKGTWAYFFRFGESALQVEAEEFMVALQPIREALTKYDEELCLPDAIATLHPRSLVGDLELNKTLIECAPSEFVNIRRVLPEELHSFQREFVLRLAPRVRHGLAHLPDDFDWKLAEEHAEKFMTLAGYCEVNMHYLLNELTPRDFAEGWQTLESLLPIYGDAAYSIVSAFKGGIETQEPMHREAAIKILNFCGTDGAKLLKAMPSQDWNSLGIEFAEQYQEAAGRMYFRFKRGLDWLNSAETQRLFNECRQVLGIRQFSRYIHIEKDGRFSRQILENALRDHGMDNPDKDLAVFCFSAADHNSAFEKNGIINEVLALRSTCHIRLIEAAHGQEITERIFASTKERPANFIYLGAHGRFNLMRFGKSLSFGPFAVIPDEASSLTIKQTASMAAIGSRVVAGGTIVLGGCSVARGGPDTANLATTFKDASPHATVIGPRCTTAPGHFVWKDSQTVPQFNCDTSKVLVLK